MNGTSACRNTRYGLLHALAVLALSAHTPRASAQPSATATPIRAHLSVEAETDCATTAALAERVRLRSRRIRFVDDARGVPKLVVQMGADTAGQRVVKLSIEWPDGQSSQRSLNAKSCAAGIDAMALLVAMTLDPGTRVDTGDTRAPDGSERDVRRDSRPRATEPRVGEAEPVANEADTSADGAATPPEDTAEAAPEASAVDDDATPKEATPATDERDADAAATSPDAGEADIGAPHPLGIDHVALGIHGQLVSDIAPEPMPGLGVYATLALNGSGVWAPALTLQLGHAWVHGLRQAAGDADFELDAAELGLCPLGARLGPLDARACGVGTLGRLSAAGSGSYLPQTHDELWASVGGAALLSVGLAHWVDLQAGAALAAPLKRYGFAFRPDVFHRIPTMCLSGHLGVGVRFP